VKKKAKRRWKRRGRGGRGEEGRAHSIKKSRERGRKIGTYTISKDTKSKFSNTEYYH
jgi:hypothetical protein